MSPSRVASRLRSMVASAADLLGAGSRRAGLVTLGVLACGAVLLPLLLLVVFAVTDQPTGSAVLGLVLGVIVDLLGVLLLVGVVTHKLTSRRQSALARSLERLATRTADLHVALETSRGEQRETLASQAAAIATARTAIGTAVTTAATAVGNRLQATQNLFALVPPRGPVPPMVGYVAAPDVLLVLVQKFLALRPSLAVECGSGTSTLFLALAAQQHGIASRLVSLEHEQAYVASTRALLAEHGVGHLADVRHAPLTATPLTDHDGPWYDPAGYADLHDIGLAFVDGPPGDVGPQARYPMVPLLADRLAGRCTILLDDMRRAEEGNTGKRWMAQLEGFRYSYLPLTRGLGVFERGC